MSEPMISLPSVAHIQTSNWQWMRISDILDHYASCEAGSTEDWEDHLDYKRSEEGFDSLVESISQDGLFWPVATERYSLFGNGHHRLAACIDLGYTHIPVTQDVTVCGWDDDDEVGLLTTDSPEVWRKTYLSESVDNS